MQDFSEQSRCNRYSICASPEDLSYIEQPSDDMEKYLNKPGFTREDMRLFND